MIDLNAKKLKHAQAERKPRYLEEQQLLKRFATKFVMACVVLISVILYGV